MLNLYRASSTKLTLILMGMTFTLGTLINYISTWRNVNDLALIWVGMLLAISFIESWLKFRAPFLRRYAGWDVGRFVFEGLNSAEVGLAASIWFGIYQRPATDRNLIGLTIVSLILLMQLIFVTPRLQLRSQFLIAQALKDESSNLSTAERKSFDELTKSISGQSMPNVKILHMTYIVMEIVKIVLLVGVALSAFT